MFRNRFYSFAFCLLVAFLAVTGWAPSVNARGQDPAFATSADDPDLRKRITALSPTIRPDEAQEVARIAYNTGRELKREWRIAWPPGLHNFLVNTGARKGGLCYQWANELLLRLDALKLQTIELHWAESFVGTMSEHNVIVVTAPGQPIERGILLDNWRYGGRLVWGPVLADPHYRWKENKPELVRRLNAIAPAKRASVRPKSPGSKGNGDR
jgi:hypothetical protein